jgi:hypothetical protein
MENTQVLLFYRKSQLPRRYPPLDEVEDGDYVAIHNRREFS